jgi:hypothetical protein
MLGHVSRRLVAAALVVAVQFAALLAPFVHAHPDDHDTDHHAAHAIHAHLSGHGHAARAVRHEAASVDDNGHDRAVFLQIFLSETAHAVQVATAVPETFELATPEERPAQRTLQVVHGHDPPIRALLGSRAPPLPLAVI